MKKKQKQSPTQAQRIAERYGGGSRSKLAGMIARYGAACSRRDAKVEAEARKEAYVQVALLRRRLEALELHIPLLMRIAIDPKTRGFFDEGTGKVRMAGEIVSDLERAMQTNPLPEGPKQ